MDDPRSSYSGPIIPENGIFITDKGIGKRFEAFHWLMLGYYVYDHKLRELTVQDLEHNIDPIGVMNPMYVRGTLWKTVHQRFWLADRGGRNGPEPAQPGLIMETSDQYYDLGPPKIQRESRSSTSTRGEEKSRQNRSSPPRSQSQTSSTWSSMLPSKDMHHVRLITSPLDNSLKTPHPRSHDLTKSRSVTSLSCESIKSSSTGRRASSVSIESNAPPQNMFIPSDPSIGGRDIDWTTEGVIMEDQPLIGGEGAHALVVGKRSRARLDSFFALRSSPRQGTATSGEV